MTGSFLFSLRGKSSFSELRVRMTSLDLQDMGHMVGAAVVSALSREAEATAAEAMVWQQEHAAANWRAETLAKWRREVGQAW
jgi:hypothetical protein